MYIFIDESGDMEALKGTRFFVIGAVFYYEKDLSQLNAFIKKHNSYIWQHGWPKNIEIKATHLYEYQKHIPDYKTRLKFNPKYYLQDIYRDINKLNNNKLGFLIHETANQGPVLQYLHKEGIYNFLSKNLYNACLSFLRDTMDIFVDQRNIRLIKQQKNVNLRAHRLNLDYIGYIRNELSFIFCKKHRMQPIIDIRFENSLSIKGLQIADYVAWACRKKYEGKPYWFDLLKRIEKIEKKDNFE